MLILAALTASWLHFQIGSGATVVIEYDTQDLSGSDASGKGKKLSELIWADYCAKEHLACGAGQDFGIHIVLHQKPGSCTAILSQRAAESRELAHYDCDATLSNVFESTHEIGPLR